MAYIYKITNADTGQQYVGKTDRSIEVRWREHTHNAKSVDTFLYRAMRKYGIEKFSIELLETVDVADTLNQRERDWIQTLRSMAPVGYNLTEGGNGGDTSQSPGYQEAMLLRDYRGSKNPMYGKLGESNPNFGSKRSDDQKQTIRAALKKKWDNNPTRKAALRNRRLGGNNPMYGKKPPNALVVVFNGETYYSLADAVRATKRSPGYIKKHGTITHVTNEQTRSLV